MAMVRANELIKNLVLNFLPQRPLQWVRRFHYARKVKAITTLVEQDLKAVEFLVEPGDYVVDIGANVGIYTKFLSDLVGLYGHVYSIEPIPQTFDILASNVRKLKMHNVELINCAISNTQGPVIMEVPLFSSGVENFYQAKITSGSEKSRLRTVKTSSITLDSLFSERPPISFIKCDVEGHELACVQGGIEIIRLLKPAMLIEISGDPDNPTQASYQTLKILEKEGYAPYLWTGYSMKERQYGDRSVNYFFLTLKHAQRFIEKGGLIESHARYA